MKEKLHNLFLSVPDIDTHSNALKTWNRLDPIQSHKIVEKSSLKIDFSNSYSKYSEVNQNNCLSIG